MNFLCDLTTMGKKKDGETEAGNSKNPMRNVLTTASGTRPCENTSTGMYSTRSRACTGHTEDSLSRENDERDEQSLNEYVKVCLEKLLKGQDDLRKEMDTFKKDIERAVNFQGEEIKQLKKDTELLKTVTRNTSSENRETRRYAEKIHAEVNNLERFSRRNNIRLVGYPESRGENLYEIVDNILAEKFGMEDVELERVHRDGKIRRGPRNRGPNRPRHILIKLLRYQDKVEIMKNRKECLKDDNYYIVDDLTGKDLEEKQRWSGRVKVLYQQGFYLHFVAGVWKDKKGNKAPFYDSESKAGLINIATGLPFENPKAQELGKDNETGAEGDPQDPQEVVDPGT